MSTQPNPEHVTAGSALRVMDRARNRLRDAEYAQMAGHATRADVEQAHVAYNAAVAAYYEARGEQR
jgi:outer membrane protein TolC